MNFLIKNKRNIIFIFTSYFFVYFLYRLNFDLIKNVSFDLTIFNVILIILFKILSITFISLRWSLVSKFCNFNLDFRNSFKQITYGQFFSIFIPSSIAIDYFKIQGLMKSNYTMKLPNAAGVDFFDRIIGISSFITLNSFVVIFFFSNEFSKFYKLSFFFTIFILILSLILLIKKLLNSSKKIALTEENKLIINYKNIAILLLLGFANHFLDLMSLLIVSNSFFDLPIINQLGMISASQFSLLISITPSAIGISENFYQIIFSFFQGNNSSVNAFNIPLMIRIINYALLSILTILIFLFLKLKYIKK